MREIAENWKKSRQCHSKSWIFMDSFVEKGLMYPGWPRICYIAKAGFECLILLSQTLKCWNYRLYPNTLVFVLFWFVLFKRHFWKKAGMMAHAYNRSTWEGGRDRRFPQVQEIQNKNQVSLVMKWGPISIKLKTSKQKPLSFTGKHHCGNRQCSWGLDPMLPSSCWISLPMKGGVFYLMKRD